jgi:hypothetical protein
MISPVTVTEDITYKWITAMQLLVKIRYADLMNYPVQLVELVKDDSGMPIFHDQHEALKGFERDLARRRDFNGDIYDEFIVEFDKPQDPQMVQLNTRLKGFDVLRAKYLDRNGELCDFKMLQIITKEKDETEFQEGTANSVASNFVVGATKFGPTPTNVPFGSPSRQTVPMPAQAPTPTPVPSSAVPTYTTNNSMPVHQHQHQSSVDQQLLAELKMLRIEKDEAQAKLAQEQDALRNERVRMQQDFQTDVAAEKERFAQEEQRLQKERDRMEQDFQNGVATEQEKVKEEWARIEEAKFKYHNQVAGYQHATNANLEAREAHLQDTTATAEANINAKMNDIQLRQENLEQGETEVIKLLKAKLPKRYRQG